MHAHNCNAHNCDAHNCDACMHTGSDCCHVWVCMYACLYVHVFRGMYVSFVELLEVSEELQEVGVLTNCNMYVCIVDGELMLSSRCRFPLYYSCFDRG